MLVCSAYLQNSPCSCFNVIMLSLLSYFQCTNILHQQLQIIVIYIDKDMYSLRPREKCPLSYFWVQFIPRLSTLVSKNSLCIQLLGWWYNVLYLAYLAVSTGPVHRTVPELFSCECRTQPDLCTVRYLGYLAVVARPACVAQNQTDNQPGTEVTQRISTVILEI